MVTDPRLREAFTLFDRDGDGEVTGPEILLVIRSCGIMPTPEEKNNLPAMMNWPMMDDWLQRKLKQCNPEEELIKAFKLFDRSGRGSISSEELSQVLKALGELLTEDEINQLIHEADPDNTGSINYASFAKELLS